MQELLRRCAHRLGLDLIDEAIGDADVTIVEQLANDQLVELLAVLQTHFGSVHFAEEDSFPDCCKSKQALVKSRGTPQLPAAQSSSARSSHTLTPSLTSCIIFGWSPCFPWLRFLDCYLSHWRLIKMVHRKCRGGCLHTETIQTMSPTVQENPSLFLSPAKLPTCSLSLLLFLLLALVPAIGRQLTLCRCLDYFTFLTSWTVNL